ncbi:rab-GTPase-TBC domain-containing protein [Dichotomocladium elegans]|nr:rab-GTPase-TBC domain-containing protein [Dichotomocladium elegans]
MTIVPSPPPPPEHQEQDSIETGVRIDAKPKHGCTTPSVRSQSSYSDDKSWDDAQSTTTESIETFDNNNNRATEAPRDEHQTAAPRRRNRGLTITQKSVVSQEAAPPPVEQENKDAEVHHDPGGHDNIDWEFWSKVVSDFGSVTKSEKKMLSVQIQRGVPSSLRGMIWQLFANSKNPSLEEKYLKLINEDSVYEKAITRDLPRTFPNHAYFQSKEGQEALFNVVKAYSLYDPDVGYCQGISFIAGPLLLNMPEEEAFCVLVQLMQRYELRGHFTPQLDLLHQRLYQFDGILHDHLPHVHRHFEYQGIRSSMYASQWFLTLFAYRYPLEFVYRIYDIFLVEGIQSIYSFGLALIQKNQATILSLEFDLLVNYLKNDMLDAYLDNASDLIRDAYMIKVSPKRFNRLAKEYRIEAARAHSEAEAIETLKKQNKALSETIRSLENSLTEISKEHAHIANELIESKMDIARVNDENDALRQQSQDLKKALLTLPNEIETRMKEEMEILVTKNAALVQRNSALEDQMAYMENMVAEIKAKYDESEQDRQGIRQRLDELKKLVD